MVLGGNVTGGGLPWGEIENATRKDDTAVGGEKRSNVGDAWPCIAVAREADFGLGILRSEESSWSAVG